MAIRWSIGRRLAIGIAIAVTLGSVALTAAVSLVQYRSQFAREVANARLYTQLIASEAAAAVHLKQAPAVDRKLASFTKAFNSTLVGTATLDAEYQPVSAYRNADLPALDMAPYLADARAELLAGRPVVRADGGAIFAAVPAVLGGSTTVGYVAALWSLGELEAGQRAALETAAGATALVLLIVLLLQVLLVRRYVSLPVGRMTGAMTRLAADDLSVAVPGLDARDEIGDMAKAVEVFKGKAVMVERLHREQAEQEARARAERQRTMGELADRFERAMAGIVGAVGETAEGLRINSAALTVAAERSNGPVNAVARISEETASSMSAVVSEADMLNRAIAAISDQVSQSADIVREAVARAGEANTTVASLSEASREVGEIVKLISSIASQTNLLALNATIEAARAGEAGKGFAVVAQEVKNLATQTTRATEEVGRQIAAIQDGTARAVAVIESIGQTVERMNSVAAGIAATVVQQGQSTRSITGNLGQSAEATRSLAEQAAEVRGLVAQTGQAATVLAEAVTELRGRAAALKEESHSFAVSVRQG